METQNNQWYNLFQAQRLKNEGADGKTRSKGRRQIFQVKQEVGSKKEWTLLPSSTFLFYSGPQGLDGAHHIRRVIYFICPFILILNSPETSSQTHPFAQSSWHRKLTIIVCLLSAKTQLHECRKHFNVFLIISLALCWSYSFFHSLSCFPLKFKFSLGSE